MKTYRDFKEQVARLEASGSVYAEIADMLTEETKPIDVARHCLKMLQLLTAQIKILNEKEIPEYIEQQKNALAGTELSIL